MATLVKLIDLQVEKHDADSTEIITLFKYLKKSLSTKQINFSLDFTPFGKLTDNTSEVKYDLVISDLFDKIIVGANLCLKVFERPQLSFSGNGEYQVDCLFSVEYTDSFHCLRLVNEKSEEFIYATTQASVIKISVRDLMEKRSKYVWRCEKSGSNVWGFDLWGKQLYVLDYSRPFISVMNRDTGMQVTEEKMDIDTGYGFQFMNENEVLTSHGNFLEIFERNGSDWISKRKKEITASGTAYSLFYEKASSLVYLSDSSKNEIIVMRLADFSIVSKCTNQFKQNYGIMIDKKTGLLYVCDSTKREIYIFK